MMLPICAGNLSRWRSWLEKLQPYGDRGYNYGGRQHIWKPEMLLEGWLDRSSVGWSSNPLYRNNSSHLSRMLIIRVRILQIWYK